MSMGITIFNNSAGGGGGAAPSGVAFQQITPSQHTSYLSGDEGWRVQNGIFAYTPPTNPKVYAELDYSSANFWYVLKNPLIVNGVSSTTRFVDINGVQVFSATGNADKVVIDKLTGRMWLRNRIGNNQFATFISNALTYSIVVNGITYSDWYLPSQNEFISLYQDYATTPINVDSLTSANILSTSFSSQTSTTNATLTTQSKCYINTSRTFINLAKGQFDYGATYITDAKNLITAP